MTADPWTRVRFELAAAGIITAQATADEALDALTAYIGRAQITERQLDVRNADVSMLQTINDRLRVDADDRAQRNGALLASRNAWRLRAERAEEIMDDIAAIEDPIDRAIIAYLIGEHDEWIKGQPAWD